MKKIVILILFISANAHSTSYKDRCQELLSRLFAFERKQKPLEIKRLKSIKRGGRRGAQALQELEDMLNDPLFTAGEVFFWPDLYRGPTGIGVLKKLLAKNPSEKVKKEITVFAGRIGGNAGIDVLEEILKQELSLDLQIAVVQSLNEIVREGRFIQEGVFKRSASPERLRVVRIFELLLKNDPSFPVQLEIVRHISQLENSVGDRILKQLLETKQARQMLIQIAQSAGEIGGETGADILKELAIKKFSSEVQTAIATAVGFMTKATSTGGDALKEMLKQNPSRSLLIEIAQSAGKIGGFAGTDVLEEMLKQELSSDVQIAIVRSANHIEVVTEFNLFKAEIFKEGSGDKISRERLGAVRIFDLLLERNLPFPVQLEIAQLASRMRSSDGARILRQLLKRNPSEGVLKEIAQSADRIGGVDGIGVLNEMVDQQFSSEVQTVIAMALGLVLEKSSSIGVLKKMLKKNPSSQVLVQIAKSAVLIGRAEGISLLREMFVRDVPPEVQIQMAISAGWIGGERGAGFLKEMLKRDLLPKVKKEIAISAGGIEFSFGIDVLKEMLIQVLSTQEQERISAYFESFNIKKTHIDSLKEELLEKIGFSSSAQELVSSYFESLEVVQRTAWTFERGVSMFNKLSFEQQKDIVVFASRIGGDVGVGLLQKLLVKYPPPEIQKVIVLYMIPMESSVGMPVLKQLLERKALSPEVMSFIALCAVGMEVETAIYVLDKLIERKPPLEVVRQIFSAMERIQYEHGIDIGVTGMKLFIYISKMNHPE